MLSYSGIRWYSCDTDIDNTARAEFGDEESKERPKERIMELKEVAGPDLLRVSSEKR